MNGSEIAGVAGTIAGSMMKGAVGLVCYPTVAGTDPAHLAVLVFSAILWLISLFLLWEGAKILKWMMVDEPGAPNPRSGVILFSLASFLIVGFWFFYRIYFYLYHHTYPVGMPALLIHAPLSDPLEFVPGFILAAIPLVIVGSVKLVTILLVSGKMASGGKASKKPVWLALFYLVFQVLSAGASAATLYNVFLRR